MIVQRECWGDIPLLHVYHEKTTTQTSPVVVFLHGFTSAKEHNLHYAYQLANEGVRVLLPDALLHGERDEGLDEIQLSLRFWEIVLSTIEEVEFLKSQLVEKGLLESGKIGVAGTSMGGIETLGCLKKYSWISAASVMMGAPGYVNLAKAQIEQYEAKGFKLPITEEELQNMYQILTYFDLTEDPSVLQKRPIFFWHGQKDPVVPFQPTYAFYEAIREDYRDVPHHLHFMADRQAGHAVSRKGMLAATKWLNDHLN